MCIAVAILVVLSFAGTAAAYDESTDTVPGFSETNCGPCHKPYNGGAGVFTGTGVHGGYLTTTDKCHTCHTVHRAPSNGAMLLPGPTLQSACFTCHDGTQGRGVYGAIAARGLAVGAAHHCETTTIVPGGDGATGGDSAQTLSGWGTQYLTCNDCHSPHAASVIATSVPGERKRITGMGPVYWTNRLLKQLPGDATQPVTLYGSDWCLACHRGRTSASPTPHNHPVDATGTATSPFHYRNVAVLASTSPTSVTVLGALGGANTGYLMPYPRTAQQQGHAPICQQCHEDARFVGTLSADGATGDAATWTVTQVDGWAADDNPRFGTFPHETTSRRLLVETDDDLCTNCHPTAVLP